MDISSFRHQLKHEAEGAYATMANESINDSQEQFLTDIVFDESPEVVQQKIRAGESITGHVHWMGGFRSPFEAHRYHFRVVAKFGPWEKLPQET